MKKGSLDIDQETKETLGTVSKPGGEGPYEGAEIHEGMCAFIVDYECTSEEASEKVLEALRFSAKHQVEKPFPGVLTYCFFRPPKQLYSSHRSSTLADFTTSTSGAASKRQQRCCLRFVEVYTDSESFSTHAQEPSVSSKLMITFEPSIRRSFEWKAFYKGAKSIQKVRSIVDLLQGKTCETAFRQCDSRRSRSACASCNVWPESTAAATRKGREVTKEPHSLLDSAAVVLMHARIPIGPQADTAGVPKEASIKVQTGEATTAEEGSLAHSSKLQQQWTQHESGVREWIMKAQAAMAAPQTGRDPRIHSPWRYQSQYLLAFVDNNPQWEKEEEEGRRKDCGEERCVRMLHVLGMWQSSASALKCFATAGGLSRLCSHCVFSPPALSNSDIGKEEEERGCLLHGDVTILGPEEAREAMQLASRIPADEYDSGHHHHEHEDAYTFLPFGMEEVAGYACHPLRV